ncbi:DMT family transporter [Ideonella sp. A 288]|uniref:DMT family transporter n=1 Tax=Ideonella sp. A 288 TaxID=1962181 RepID=UPI000B4BFFCD|nr:DMT family transporter [Ideonella sp. A 288]
MQLNRLQADGLLLFVALIWGSAFVAQNWGMASMGPMGFTGVRFLIGALAVLPLAWREQRALRARGLGLTRADHARIAGLGVLLCAGAALQQVGIQHTTVTNAGFLTAVYVPLVPLLGWWLLGDRPHPMVWPCALACLAGTWLLSSGSAAAAAGPLAFNQGDLWVLASVLPWTLHVLLVGRVAERLAAPFSVACGQFVACGVLALALGAVLEPLSLAGMRDAWGALAYTGLVSVAIGFTAQVVGQRWTRPADAAIVLSSETLFAALFGAWLMGDRLGPAGWAGCALMLASIVAVQLLPRRPA